MLDHSFKKISSIPSIENEKKFFELLDSFFDFSLPKKLYLKNNCGRTCKRIGLLKDEIIREELKNSSEAIRGFYGALKVYLIAGISEEEFADLYLLNLTYGLFAERLRSENKLKSYQVCEKWLKDRIGRELSYEEISIYYKIEREILRTINIQGEIDEYYLEVEKIYKGNF